ncbi:hypothetical protein H0H92_013227 [Tricholoma furcatifolium]|nr:hypothetical protein H0H92_013227 [Tricholoma furcatifolium]
MSDNLVHMSKRNKSNSSTSTADNLPPPRISKPLRLVSPPLSNTRLHRLIYLLALLTTILTAYYAYRIVQHKNEFGGWWNLALRRRPPQTQFSGEGFRRGVKEKSCRDDDDSVEERINALAHALGMPPKDLASAIAVAVREYVPPASLSSVAARETGPAVQAMLKGTEIDNEVKEDEISQTFGVVGGVVEGFVGMDEPE